MQNNKILIVSLGCDKNLVDTEFMLGILDKAGYEFTDDEYEADVIVINTCAFINDAKEESINTIIDLGKRKEDANLKALIVCGCLAERYEKEIKSELPEVDAILGTNSWDKILTAIDEVLADKKYVSIEHEKEFDLSAGRLLTKGTHYAYLKIAEGCDKRCTYCIIPMLRGKFRSVPMEELVSQVESLRDMGIKELILVAQESSSYGKDLYGEKSLHVLLNKLSGIAGIKWIRIMYCYPEEIYPELIEEIKNNDKVVNYLDMPIQHADNDILKAMGRRTTREEITAKINKLREEIPDITLRTTMICGFPGETDKQHQNLLDFIEEMKFDRLGAFAYSPEEGTKAAEFEEQIDEEVKEDRRLDVMELNEKLITLKNQEFIGKEMWVIVDGYASNENVYVCRTYRDAPDVDGYLFLETEDVLNTGDFVRVIGAYEYDLIGEMI